MMNSIGRSRIVIASIAAVAIIVGVLLIGALPRQAATSSPSGKQVSTAPAEIQGDQDQDFKIMDYSEYGSTLATDMPSSDLFGFLLGLGAKLALVLFLVFCLLRLIRRYLGHNRDLTQEKKPVALLESLNLSPQRTVYVLEVGRKVLVVGASQSQLSLLTEITDPEAIEEMRAHSASIPGIDQFHSLVNAAKRRFGDHETVI